MRTHELKTDPGPFRRVWEGRKRAEFRRNDRDFAAGDRVILRESYRGIACSARAILAQITDVADDPRYGFPEGYAMLSIRLIDRTLLYSDRWPPGRWSIEVRTPGPEWEC